MIEVNQEPADQQDNGQNNCESAQLDQQDVAPDSEQNIADERNNYNHDHV